MEKSALQSLADAVAELQGSAAACAAMVEAILMSHPDPKALLDAWRRVSAPRISVSSVNAATKNRATDEAHLHYYGAWSEKLERLAAG